MGFYNAIKDYIITNFSKEKKSVNIILALISFGIPVLSYYFGYLFIWGYYFNNNVDSLVGVIINYVPLNNVVIIIIGIVYLILFLFSIFIIYLLQFQKEKKSYFILLLSFVFFNAGLNFFIGQITIDSFLKVLGNTSLLLFIILIVNGYYLTWNKQPLTAFKIALTVILFSFPLVLLMKYFPSLEKFLIPEMFSLLLVITISALWVIKNENIEKIVNWSFNFSLVVFISLVLNDFFNIGYFLSFIFGVVIIYIISSLIKKIYLIIIKIKQKYSKDVKDKEQAPRNNTFAKIVLFISTLFVFIMFTSQILLAGGKYLSDINVNNNYKQITYNVNNRLIELKGIIVAKQNNTYYVSDCNNNLVIFTSSEVEIVDSQ